LTLKRGGEEIVFLHLGEEKSVRHSDIIGIFNYELIKKSKSTKKFIDIMTYEGVLEKVSKDKKIKSFVVAKDKVFLSPISSTTLQKRILNFLSQND
jgi:hypothetical protein